MATGYLIGWLESERGWGTRPDGYSLHLTEKDSQEYILAELEQIPTPAPDEYSRPVDHTPVAVEIDEVLYAELAEKKNLRFYGQSLLIHKEPTGRRIATTQPVKKGPTFIELCLAKKAKPAEIDDYIDRWHDKVEGLGVQLHEYLGFTGPEYSEFLHDSNVLYRVLFERAMQKLPAPEYFLHGKSGGTYAKLMEGKLERNRQPVTIYMGVDSQVWVRETAEFNDGRFQPIGPKDH